MGWGLDPTLLASIVVGGVTGVVALTWAVGWSARAELADLDAAIARYAVEHPDDVICGGLLADDHHAALLDVGPDAVGLLWALGDGFVVRRVPRGSVRIDGTPTGLRLRLGEPGAPYIRIQINNADARSAWRAAVEV